MINMNTNHNVYILGAGFSKDAGMPLVSNFIAEMREASEWLEKNNRLNELKSIENVLEFRKEASSAAYRININIDNIESLFSLAIAIDKDKLGESIINAITATLDYCHNRKLNPIVKGQFTKDIAEKMNIPFMHDGSSIIENKITHQQSAFEMNYYDYLATMLSGLIIDSNQKNSIITFNYDLVLESAFSNISYPISYNLKHVQYDFNIDHFQNNAIPIYKLHGSMNWGFPGQKGKKLTIYKSYIDAFEKSKYRLLIPPSWQKNFSGALQSVWQNAIKSLATATRIIILGFSLPDTDIHFKYLLAAGLKDNISLKEIIFVNIESEDIFKNKINILFQHEFINNLNVQYFQTPIRSFFQADTYLQRINRFTNKFRVG